MSETLAVPSVTIRRVAEEDARIGSPYLGTLVERLQRHEESYPGIDIWVRRRVIPGLRSGERVGYVGYRDEDPILAAVVKRGRSTKFCHVSVEEGFRGKRLGRLSFSLLAAEVRNLAEAVHFTLPESLWYAQRSFFEDFGFSDAVMADTQYRMFEDELKCATEFQNVWRAATRMLPALLSEATVGGRNESGGIVLSVREPHAEAIISGEKTVEIRRRFSDRWRGHRASIYSSGSRGAVLGTVRIADVVHGDVAEIWSAFANEIGCTRAELEAYASGATTVAALRLTEVEPYTAPVPLSQLSHLIDEPLKPPQSHCAVEAVPSWERALSVAALLHGRKSSVAPMRSHGSAADVAASDRSGASEEVDVGGQQLALRL